jgi:hypothetical protein
MCRACPSTQQNSDALDGKNLIGAALRIRLRSALEYGVETASRMFSVSARGNVYRRRRCGQRDRRRASLVNLPDAARSLV